ncbi:pantetheine-phosphate adenylyltransferase [Rothia sp. P7181]|uniref:pantetheine-phosphate adenylyltransferase n=1 Tax=unclassified Rothia (in: high G+C Gram-positive bacteria) TaxID=2689056 RepID=UPI003AC9CB2F
MQLVICPGSYDPIHNGHVDVITRAAKIYGNVIVAVARNSAKSYLFSDEERVALVQETFGFLDGVSVELMPSMLLADYAKSRGAHLIVKGVRNSLDWQYESQMAVMNRHLSGVETSFLVSDSRYSQLSSTLVRDVARYGGQLDSFVPVPVQRALTQKISQEK